MILDHRRMANVSMSGDAMLWRRTRAKDDENAKHPKIESWEVMRRKLMDQFLPTIDE